MSAPKYFLDTNIFLRIISKDRPVQVQECERLVNQIKQKKINAATSGLVLAEIVWVCLKGYKLTRAEVGEVIKSILGIENLKFIEKSNVFAAGEMFFLHSIKFADCLIASHPQILSGQMTIVSYDRDFDKLGVKRIEPSEL